MKNILKKIILGIVTIIIISCTSENDTSILDSDNLIAYIENESQKGGNGLLFGKITILDIDTKEKYFLNEQESYVNNPSWSQHDKSLIYFSETESFDDPNFQFGFKLGVDIFTYDAKLNTHKILFPNLESINQKFYMMTHEVHPTIYMNTFIIPHIQKIYKIEIPKNEITKIVEFDSNYHITKIDLSPNNKYLILNASNSNFEKISQKYELLLFEVENKNIKRIANTLNSGGWDTRSENYVFRKRKFILNYNIKSNIIDTINIPVNFCSEIKYDKNNNLIGLGGNTDDLTIPNEIFIYDLKNDHLDWLTHDKIFKENINVLL